MLYCENQPNPIEYRGRQLQIPDSWLNVYYTMCGVSLDESTIRMYVDFELQDLSEMWEYLTDEELVGIVERGIKDEAFSLIPNDVLREHWLMWKYVVIL